MQKNKENLAEPGNGGLVDPSARKLRPVLCQWKFPADLQLWHMTQSKSFGSDSGESVPIAIDRYGDTCVSDLIYRYKKVAVSWWLIYGQYRSTTAYELPTSLGGNSGCVRVRVCVCVSLSVCVPHRILRTQKARQTDRQTDRHTYIWPSRFT